MTKDQIRRECARLQSVLDAYEAKAVATSVPDHHSGLRQRLEAMEQKLKAMDRLYPLGPAIGHRCRRKSGGRRRLAGNRRSALSVHFRLS